ncbi:DUF7344 domain-containing protein [Natronobiforma cellulositropha]|uniref:DUF7344 domain-containing protein n=1 Tax=Natronobiforma cellulositropha TaxID=1679076 RepID=UPI0021D604EE|nr:hypothetical protein [Natronobiforma cellulositropha]
MSEESLQTVAFELCRDHHRRLVLSILLDDERPMTLNDLSKGVATRAHGRPITELPDDAVVDTYCRLYHIHIPKLADAGALTHDVERNLVDTGERYGALRPYVSRIVASSARPAMPSD